jgi:hypothetical protein
MPRPWWFSWPKWVWIGIGAFIVGLTTVLANLTAVLDYLDGEPPTPAVQTTSAPVSKEANQSSQSSVPPAEVSSSIGLSPQAPPRADRPEQGRRAVEDEVKAEPAATQSAGDYSVLVSNSPYANTQATYNINVVSEGPDP